MQHRRIEDEEGSVAEHGEGDLVILTMKEWAEQEGPGWFCSTEY